MRFVLLFICILGLLLVAACEKSSEASHIIAESVIDFDQNGIEETLKIRMVTGEFKEETEPGPLMGAYWKGEFRLELTSGDGTTLFTKELNTSFGDEALIFSEDRSFQIAFEDYNNDGHLDFSIGQYVSLNGFTYNLYSLMPDGITTLHRNIISAAGEYSILYEKVGSTSFKNRYYDQEKGEYLETLYTWQGDQFVLTECEGCGMTASGTEDELPREIKLVVEKMDDGFRLASGEGGRIYVSQTLTSPDIEGSAYAVHIVRTDKDNQAGGYGVAAVVVNPETSDFSVYPLFHAILDHTKALGDRYAAASVAYAYGFLNERQLVYVAVVNDADRKEGYFYRVESLNIITGEKIILFSEIPNVLQGDHFALGWMNKANDTLVLNSFNNGQLWLMDLLNMEMKYHETGITHSWPYYLTVRSPDGERFWHSDIVKREYRIYDKSATLLSSTPFRSGHTQYPYFLWSPNSQFSARQDTRDLDPTHIISEGGEYYTIAPQRIHFYDQDGKPLRTIETDIETNKYIELAGWIDDPDGYALLHEYELDLEQKTEYDTPKINSSFKLLNINSGVLEDLQIETEMNKWLAGLAPVYTIRRHFSNEVLRNYLVDLEHKKITILTVYGKWLSDPDDTKVKWFVMSLGGRTAIYYEYGPDTRRIREKALHGFSNDVRLVGADWIVWGDMQYTRLE